MLLRLPVLVGLVAALVAPVLPAYAGPAETALLARFAGDWRGTGNMTGPDPGKVVCRLAFKTTSSGRLTYTGRCSTGMGASSFRGSMLYNDARKRFEASSSAQGAVGTTVGKKQGNSLVFSSSGIKTIAGTASSTMTLSPSSIKMSFRLVDKDGEVIASSISFARN